MATYHGYIRTPADAVCLFEACRLGILPRVQQRLSEKESESIKSGSVFVWDEREAGIQRWTDGKFWSSSRVSGRFLIYRELEGRRGEGQSTMPSIRQAGKYPGSRRGSDENQMDIEELVRSRVKPDGLTKRLFNFKTSTGKHLHIISYYNKQHVNSDDLPRPTTDPKLRHIRPAKEMYPGSTTAGELPIQSSPYKPLPQERLNIPISPGHDKQILQPYVFSGYMSPRSQDGTPPSRYQSPFQSKPALEYASICQSHEPPNQTTYNRLTPPLLNLPVLPLSPISLPPINEVPHMATPPLLNLLLLPHSPTPLPPIDEVRRTPTPPSINSISYMMNWTDSFPAIGADKSDNSHAKGQIPTQNGEQGLGNTVAYEKLNDWVADQRAIRLLDQTLVF